MPRTVFHDPRARQMERLALLPTRDVSLPPLSGNEHGSRKDVCHMSTIGFARVCVYIYYVDVILLNGATAIHPLGETAV